MPSIEHSDTLTAPQVGEPVFSRTNPFPAVLLKDVVLNGRGSIKETRHVELSLAGSGLTWEPGDSVGIYPTNAPDVVETLLQTLRFTGDEPVHIADKDIDLRTALLGFLECTTLTRSMMQAYAREMNNERLNELLAPTNRSAFNEYLDGRELVDLVTDFPPNDIHPQQLVESLRKIPPRLYSIASSIKKHPDEIHLTVVALRYRSHNRNRKGVCSTYFAERISEGASIPLYLSRNRHFKLPTDPSASIIMVGPGTGIAPFRAFVQEREALGAPGKNWLFFGDQHLSTDFLYQTEWERYLKKGVLTRMDVAFSRDQVEKVYVQHRLRERARDVYAWLQEGAQFYVCGDKERMGPAVHEALLDIVEHEGARTREQAEEYVKTLLREKRYQRDVY